MTDKRDAESLAMGKIMSALSSLPDDEARKRVLKYAHERCDAHFGWTEQTVEAVAKAWQERDKVGRL